MSDERIAVGIIGLGMVGATILRWLEEVRGYRRGVDLFCYDASPTLSYHDDYNRAQLVFVAVPTPPNPDGSCNTSVVRSVVGQLTGSKIVAIKSTVPPGTMMELQRKYSRHLFLFNPEFLTESQAWADFIHPFRQIIGVTPQSISAAVDVLNLLPQASFCRPFAPIYGLALSVTSTEAELAKYASNVFGAVKVVFANILADICYTLGRETGDEVKIERVCQMLGADPRITPSWLDIRHGSYCGFGGYCFPKDIAALISFYRWLLGQFTAAKLRANGINGAYYHVLYSGLHVLEAVCDYNEALLAAQGLTVADVSQHNMELVLNKLRPIRTE